MSDVVLRAIERFVTSGMVAFDIGANRGLTARTLSDRGATVFAFEPIPACIAEIHEKAIPNVTVVEKAVADAPGTAEFHLDNRPGLGMEASSLRKLDGIDGDVITVPITTIDAFCEEQGVAPAFIKIDVEGVEEKVLAGGMDTIRKHKPVMIFEVWGYNWPRFEAVVASLADLYHFEVASNGADALVHYGAGVITENDDVICIPR